jgi:hypothetical protein
VESPPLPKPFAFHDDGTVTADGPPIGLGALPFSAATGANPTALIGGDDDYTEVIDSIPKSVSLPFKPNSPASPSSGDAPPMPAPLRFAKQVSASPGETLPVGFKSPFAKAALPFGDEAPRSQRSEAIPASTPSESWREPPKVPPPTSALPVLSIEQYAAFCVEVWLHPKRTSETLARYGVRDDASRLALDAAWAERFGREPETEEQWRALCAHYREWFRSNKR